MTTLPENSKNVHIDYDVKTTNGYMSMAFIRAYAADYPVPDYGVYDWTVVLERTQNGLYRCKIGSAPWKVDTGSFYLAFQFSLLALLPSLCDADMYSAEAASWATRALLQIGRVIAAMEQINQ